MEREDERIEALLRQFQPRAPRALPLAADSERVAGWRDQRSTMRVGGWAGVAAAAAAAVFAANLRFMPMARLAPDVVVGPGLTLHDMRGLLEADPATLDRLLMEASRHALPDVEAPDSALRPLALP
jgi:hypothetical protein